MPLIGLPRRCCPRPALPAMTISSHRCAQNPMTQMTSSSGTEHKTFWNPLRFFMRNYAISELLPMASTLCSSFRMDAMATTTKMAGITSLPAAKLLRQKSTTTMGVSTGSAPASSMTALTTSSGGMAWSRFPG